MVQVRDGQYNFCVSDFRSKIMFMELHYLTFSIIPKYNWQFRRDIRSDL